MVCAVWLDVGGFVDAVDAKAATVEAYEESVACAVSVNPFPYLIVVCDTPNASTDSILDLSDCLSS